MKTLTKEQLGQRLIWWQNALGLTDLIVVVNVAPDLDEAKTARACTYNSKLLIIDILDPNHCPEEKQDEYDMELFLVRPLVSQCFGYPIKADRSATESIAEILVEASRKQQ